MISITNLKKKYGDFTAVDGLSFVIHDPEILILDEPEAGLDPQSRILVRDFIKASGKEKTIIITTHNMDEADRLADRIAIIDYGKLLLDTGSLPVNGAVLYFRLFPDYRIVETTV
jgi:ABC-type multidrug transport system ATPase subunit